MCFKSKLLGLVLLAVLVTPSFQQKPPEKCKMSLDDLDKCAIKMTYVGDRDLIIPTNDQELDAHCLQMNETISCLRRYSRTCLQGFAQNFFNIFLYDARKQIKKRCSSNIGRQEFIKHISCILPKSRIEPMHQCVDNYVAGIEWATANVKKEDQVTASCCSFHVVHKCFLDQFSALCPSSPESRDYMDKLVTAYVSETIDYTCGIFKDLEACDKNFDPKIWGQLSSIGKDAIAAGFKAKYKSPLTPRLSMLSQIE